MEYCALCRKKFEAGEKIELVNKGCGPYPGVYVHASQCFKEYEEKYLSGEMAKKRGPILGLCFECERPVRQDDRCIVGREYFPDKDVDDDERERILLTTIPCCTAVFTFFHYECPS